MSRLGNRSTPLVAGVVTAVVAVAITILATRGASSDCRPEETSSCAPYEAPDPGGDEAAEVAVPPPGIAFGFNESPPGLGADAAIRLVGLARTAGATALRFPLDWRLVEPSPGVWDESAWDSYRTLYGAILASDMTPVINFGFAPAWARDLGTAQACADFFVCRYPPARSMLEGWAEFASEVARRFPEAVLEVWNEPNLAIFWRPAPEPERFAELQGVANDAIKRVDPSIEVLAGGLAMVPPAPVPDSQPAEMSTREFLDRAYEATPSIRDEMDAISVHAYPSGGDLGEGSVFAQGFFDVRSAAASHDDAGRRLWVTELGIPTEGAGSVSEGEQADILGRAYRRVATMDDVDGIFLHRLVPPADPAAAIERGYALLRVSGGAKPAYCWFAVMSGSAYPGC